MTKKIIDPFFNQNNIRYLNQKRVYDLLRVSDYSCSKLSKVLGLSNTALANIMRDFIRNDIVKVSEASIYSGMGKPPTVYTLNPHYGIVFSIDMTDIDIIICGAKMNNQIVFKKIIENKPYIDIDTIRQIVDLVKEFLEQNGNDYILRAISIGTPGKIDKNTGYFIFAPKIIDCKKINLKKIFLEAFDTLVLINNDIRLALIGEMTFGAVIKKEQSIFLHIDYNYGGAFALNGKVFEGQNGFAGEFGGLREYDKNENYRYTSFSISLGGIIEEIKKKLLKFKGEHSLKDKDNFNIDDITNLFICGDPIITEILEVSSEKTAISILNIVSLLDIENVIIDGRISHLGNKYLNLINKAIDKYSDKTRTIEVKYSELLGRATILGGLATAIEESTLKILRDN